MTAELTSAVASANLSGARWLLYGAANPGVAGYFCGGRNPTLNADLATGDKLIFATDTTSAVATANLTTATEQAAALSERSTKAYFCGGIINPGAGTRTNVGNKLVFSTDTTATQASANLSTSRTQVVGLSEGTTKGYFAGGSTGPPPTQQVTAEKIVFSTDTAAAQASANLTLARGNTAGGSDGSTKGYWVGGINGAVFETQVDKIAFSTDTTSSVAGASFDREAGSMGSDGTKLFCLGGDSSLVNFNSSGLKITFSTETVAGVAGGGSLSSGRAFVAGLTTVAL